MRYAECNPCYGMPKRQRRGLAYPVSELALHVLGRVPLAIIKGSQKWLPLIIVFKRMAAVGCHSETLAISDSSSSLPALAAVISREKSLRVQAYRLDEILHPKSIRLLIYQFHDFSLQSRMERLKSVF